MADQVNVLNVINLKTVQIGLVTSPILSNIYMKEFDNIVYGKLKKLKLNNVLYTRYADDMVISVKHSDEAIDMEAIKKVIEEQLKRKGLRLNEKKERTFNILRTKHVKITGINITRDEDNYRTLSVGRKKKDELYNKTMQYIELGISDKKEALKLKGVESFILSVEGREYEKCYSEKMIAFVKKMAMGLCIMLLRTLNIKMVL